MFAKTPSIKAAQLLIAMILCLAWPLAVDAQSGQTGSGQVQSDDADPGTAWTIRQNYFKRFPWAKAFGPQGSDQVSNGTSQGPGSVTPNSGPIYKWPATVSSGSASSVPTHRDEGITKYSVKTFGYPVSDTQFQVIQRLDDNMMLEEAFDPERWMWLENAVGAIKATSAANSMANLERNQAVGAIGFVQSFLENFTADSGNVWNKIRDQLFVPMAVLLLLPGAVLTQVRAIVAQGSPVFGEVNPFEGIFRAIAAIFLIPATYLVVNYGIDVANSISYEINQGYTRVTGGNMYQDAAAAQARAFPIRQSSSNLNQIPPTATTPSNTPTVTSSDPWAQLEAISFQIDAQNGNKADADEVSPVLKSTQRAVVNGVNGGLSATWNVLCAFQMAYLYYLFCIGPVVAALWVWPTQQLRNAFPSWVEGVITVCFWSLFWNTTVLLMACFKDVGTTGTIIMSALNFLAISCVKNAFDFAGLVKSAGDQISQQMQKQGGGQGGAGSHGSPSAGKSQQLAHGLGLHGTHPTPAGHGTAHGDSQTGHGLLHSPAALHAASAALSQGFFAGNGDSLTAGTNAGKTGLFDSSTHAGNSTLPPPLTSASALAQHNAADGKAAMPAVDRSYNLASQSGDGHGLAAPPPGSSSAAAHGTDPGVPGALDPAHGHGSASASAASTGGLTANSQASIDHTAVGRAANGMDVAPPPLTGNYAGSGSEAGANGHALDGSVHPNSSSFTTDSAAHPLGSASTTDGTANGAAHPVDGTMFNHGMVPPLAATPAGLPNDAAHPALPAGHALDQNSLHGLGTLASPSHAGDFHVVDAHTGQSVSSSNLHGLSQIPGEHNLQAVGADGKLLATYDANNHQWTAAGTHGNVTMGADGSWSAGNHVAVSMDQNGNWAASGTAIPYDSHSNSFDVNGHALPTSAVSGGLLTAAAGHVPSAEATVHALSQPGVAGNLSAALHGDQQAQHNFAEAAHAQGLNPETLYHASQGDSLAAASVMGSHASADPAYAHQLASSLGVSEGTITGAAHNPIAQAQVVGAEAQHSPQFAHDAAASLGAHSDMLLSAAHNPVAAAHIVGAEAASNPAFAHAVASDLHIPAEMVAQAAHNPIMAAQLVGAEAHANPQFAQAVAESMGVHPDMVMQAASNPVLAAQMVGAEAHSDAGYAHLAAHELGVSPEVLSHAAASPVLAAQMVGMEAHADAQYAHFVADQMHAHPEQIASMAHNPIMAAQAVAYEAQLNHDYGAYVAHALHVEPETIASAVSSARAATHLVEADAHAQEALASFAGHSAGEAAISSGGYSVASDSAAPSAGYVSNDSTVASSAGYVSNDSTVASSAGWSDADSYSSVQSYAPASAGYADSGSVISASESIAYQQDAYAPPTNHGHYGDAPSAVAHHDGQFMASVDAPAAAPSYSAQSEGNPVASVENYAAQPEAYIGSSANEWSFDPQSQLMWSSDGVISHSPQSDVYSAMSDNVPPQSPNYVPSSATASGANVADPFVAAAYVANSSTTSHEPHASIGSTANTGTEAADYSPIADSYTDAAMINTVHADVAPVSAQHGETSAPVESAAVDMHDDGGSYYVGGGAPSAQGDLAGKRPNADRESSSRLMAALGRAAAPKATSGQNVPAANSASTADAPRNTGESLLNQLTAVSRGQARNPKRSKQIDEQLMELRQLAEQNNWA